MALAPLRALRLAVRALGRAPTFTAVCIVTIALGVGATTTVYSVVDGVLFRPLGYRAPNELLYLSSTHGDPNGRTPPSYLDYRDWREARGTMVDMAFARGEGMRIRGADGTERVSVATVSDGFFQLFGATPLLGRTFAADEERPGGPRVVVIAYGFWQSHFAGAASAIGSRLSTTDGEFTVIGVMPANFIYPFEWASLWTPLGPTLDTNPALKRRDLRVDNRVVARLKPGRTRAQAQSELDAIAAHLASTNPEDAGWTIRTEPLREVVIGDVRPALLVLLGSVGFVLLIACANVANLTLARATTRAREISVRAALGAERSRLVGTLLAESAVIAIAGGVLGVLLAMAGVGALRAAAPSYLPRLGEIAIDPRVLVVTAGLCIVATLLVGLAPALHVTGGDLIGGLKEGTSGGGRGRRGSALRAALVLAELALSVVLLIGAGLLVRSFLQLTRVDPGFRTEGLLTVGLSPDEARTVSAPATAAIYTRIRDDVATIPGVRSVGLINHAPLTNGGVPTPVSIPGYVPKQNEDTSAVFRLVDESYFATIGQRVVSGRALTAADMQPTSRAIVVNQTLAKHYWGDASPIGRRIIVRKQLPGRDDYNQPIDAEVVGVVADTRDFGLTVDPAETVYVPMFVNPWRRSYLEIRTAGDPAALVPVVRDRVRKLEPDLLLKDDLRTATSLLDDWLAQRRFQMRVLAIFAAAALLLASVGVYGVLAFTVAQRTREIGVRAALGATPAALRSQFVRSALRLVAIGLALGLIAAFLLARLLGSLLFGVGPRDPLTFATVPVVLAVVALIASWVPARRASRVDPVVALRAD